MTEAKRKKANLVQLLIKQGWNPPMPTNRIVERIADDIERIANAREGLYTAPSLDLSPAQLRAITLVSQGYTRTEAAALLGCKEETVKTHLRNVTQRLGAKNAPHAVAICIREGLIDPNAELKSAA